MASKVIVSTSPLVQSVTDTSESSSGRRDVPKVGGGSGTGRNIDVRGSVTGSALITGGGNQASVTYTSGVPLSDDRAEITAALEEIRAALQALSGPRAGTAKREADAAIQQASSHQPDKDAIGGALQSALEAAKTTTEFAGAAAKLAPYVKTVASWLGGEWTTLIGLLG